MVVCLYICASWQKKSSTVWVKKAFFFPVSSWKYQYIGWQLVLTFSCVFLQNTNWISNKPKSYTIDSGTGLYLFLDPRQLYIPMLHFSISLWILCPEGLYMGLITCTENLSLFKQTSLRKCRFLDPNFIINHLCSFRIRQSTI